MAVPVSEPPRFTGQSEPATVLPLGRPLPSELLELTFVGNPAACRLEGEVSLRSENGFQPVIAILFEDARGWHLEVEDPDLIAADYIERAKNLMGHYVNRVGDSPPTDLNVGQLSLWLMLKDDGTAMGMQYKL